MLMPLNMPMRLVNIIIGLTLLVVGSIKVDHDSIVWGALSIGWIVGLIWLGFYLVSVVKETKALNLAVCHCYPDRIVRQWRHNVHIIGSLGSLDYDDWYYMIQPADGSTMYFGLLTDTEEWARLESCIDFKVLTKNGIRCVKGPGGLPAKAEKAFLRHIVPGYCSHIVIKT